MHAETEAHYTCPLCRVAETSDAEEVALAAALAASPAAAAAAAAADGLPAVSAEVGGNQQERQDNLSS